MAGGGADSKFTSKEKDGKKDFNEDFLAKLIDNTVGHYCLKLFTMIVNAYANQGAHAI